MNSHHLKECVRSHSVFDFLRETVSRVPDIDPESGGGESGRRRKAVEGENNDSADEENKRPKPDQQGAFGRGRGRSRGRGRGSKSNSERVKLAELDKVEDNEVPCSPHLSEDGENSKSPANDVEVDHRKAETERELLALNKECPKDFDLNMDLDENGEVAMEKEDHSQWLQGLRPDVFSLKAQQEQSLFQPEEDYDCCDEE